MCTCSPSLRGTRAGALTPSRLPLLATRDAFMIYLLPAPQVEWGASVHDHAALLAEYLHSALAAAFPLQHRRLRKSFLSEETGHRHAELSRSRHALRQRLEALRFSRLRCAWVVWRSEHSTYDVVFGGRWLKQLRWVIAFLIEHIGQVGKDLRRLCRRDKRAHVDSLADAVQGSTAGEVHVAVKRAAQTSEISSSWYAPPPPSA